MGPTKFQKNRCVVIRFLSNFSRSETDQLLKFGVWVVFDCINVFDSLDNHLWSHSLTKIKHSVEGSNTVHGNIAPQIFLLQIMRYPTSLGYRTLRYPIDEQFCGNYTFSNNYVAIVIVPKLKLILGKIEELEVLIAIGSSHK